MAYELARPFADAELKYYVVVYDPVHGGGALVTGVIVTIFDITERRRSEEEVRASQQRLKAIVDTAADAIVVIDDLGHIQSINPATERLFGYSPADLVGENVSKLMPEPDRTKHDSYLEAFLRTGKAKIIGSGREVEGRRKDGSVFPIDLSVVEWRLAEKRYFTGLMRDVTDRKKREKQVDHLLREVNHRAKNMLALVQAVAMQTAATEPQDFVERFAERIQGLAASQDLLVRSQWQGIQLQELVRSQLAHFTDLIDVRITLKGPALRISASSAQTIGMSLHELATNAGKYGALSNPTGTVAITWEFGHDPAGSDRFRLTWTENGGPAVLVPSRCGFGTKVIAAMPRASLSADVVLEYAPEGVRWRLDCPANNVIDSGSSH